MAVRVGLQEVDWGYVGACLAREGHHEQVEFFKSFVKECRSWGTSYQVETQLSYINGCLSSDERDTLSMISYNE